MHMQGLLYLLGLLGGSAFLHRGPIIEVGFSQWVLVALWLWVSIGGFRQALYMYGFTCALSWQAAAATLPSA